jgi:outer membrane protein assembly factor BamB
VVLVAAALAVFLAACGGGDDAAAPTTTVDPLAPRAVDGCGHDISALTSTVTAVDPTTGRVVWTASVPLADVYLLRDDSGGVRVPLQRRSVDALIDVDTGQVLDYPPAGVHEVLVDVSGTATGVVGMQVVDGERRPEQVAVDGLAVEVVPSNGPAGREIRGITPDGTVGWSTPVPSSVASSLTARPVLYGDVVVVATSDEPVPTCI